MNLLRNPLVFRLVASVRNRQLGLLRWVTPDTDLLIEGFPRSANTFFMRIIRAATGEDLRIASHLHRPEQIEMAMRYGVPGVIIFREPLECVASLVVRNPDYAVRDSLMRYKRFCEAALASDPNTTLVLDFEDVTRAPEVFAKAVLAHFGFDHTPIDADLITHATRDTREAKMTSSLPNPEKDAKKAEVYSAIRADPTFATTAALFEEVMARKWPVPADKTVPSA
ncbi:MAG: hypothetical protein AAGA34_06695 [Pseudomonadota bacterium]